MNNVPQVMGILNVTPDSFSDGGKFVHLATAMRHARQMVSAGVQWIDIGGESTRPGARTISEQQELDRILPVVEKIRAELPVKISVDTSKACVMRESIKLNADMINDIMALRGEHCLATVAESSTIRLCLMHLQGEPRTMQENPYYGNVVQEVKDFLLARAQACLDVGIGAERLIIDPGFGFGKTLHHNLLLMKQLSEFTALPYPVLIGVSRKSMIGKILDKPVHKRLHGGLALAVFAVNQGAQFIRTHDVAATVEALNVIKAINEAGVAELEMAQF
jgi:dihydropteroate synthase